jgi:hypothetical protein
MFTQGSVVHSFGPLILGSNYLQQQQQPSLLFPSKLGRLEMKPHELKKTGTKQEQKRRGKTNGDKNQIKKGEKVIKR